MNKLIWNLQIGFFGVYHEHKDENNIYRLKKIKEYNAKLLKEINIANKDLLN